MSAVNEDETVSPCHRVRVCDESEREKRERERWRASRRKALVGALLGMGWGGGSGRGSGKKDCLGTMVWNAISTRGWVIFRRARSVQPPSK